MSKRVKCSLICFVSCIVLVFTSCINLSSSSDITAIVKDQIEVVSKIPDFENKPLWSDVLTKIIEPNIDTKRSIEILVADNCGVFWVPKIFRFDEESKNWNQILFLDEGMTPSESFANGYLLAGFSTIRRFPDQSVCLTFFNQDISQYTPSFELKRSFNVPFQPFSIMITKDSTMWISDKKSIYRSTFFADNRSDVQEKMLIDDLSTKVKSIITNSIKTIDILDICSEYQDCLFVSFFVTTNDKEHITGVVKYSPEYNTVEEVFIHNFGKQKYIQRTIQFDTIGNYIVFKYYDTTDASLKISLFDHAGQRCFTFSLLSGSDGELQFSPIQLKTHPDGTYLYWLDDFVLYRWKTPLS
jgi:hypothetical protein